MAGSFIRSLGLTEREVHDIYERGLRNFQAKDYADYFKRQLSNTELRDPRVYKPACIKLFADRFVKQAHDGVLLIQLFHQAKVARFDHEIGEFARQLPAGAPPPRDGRSGPGGHGADVEEQETEAALQQATKEVQRKIDDAEREKKDLEAKILDMKKEYAKMVEYADPYSKYKEYQKILNPQNVIQEFQNLPSTARDGKAKDEFMECYRAAKKYCKGKLDEARIEMEKVLEEHLGRGVGTDVGMSTSLETTLLKELNLQDNEPYVTEIAKQVRGVGNNKSSYCLLAWRIVLQRPEMKVIDASSQPELVEGGRVVQLCWPALEVEGGVTILAKPLVH